MTVTMNQVMVSINFYNYLITLQPF